MGAEQKYLQMMTAIGESSRYDGYSLDSIIRQYREACNDDTGFLLYFANWLQAKDLLNAAAAVYGTVAEVSDTESMKGYYLYKKGLSLKTAARYKSQPECRILMKPAALTMEEAAEHFLAAGEEGREWFIDAMNMAGGCFIEAGEAAKAVEIIRRRLQAIRQMEGNADSKFIATSYNSTGILCHNLCTGTDEAGSIDLQEIAAVGCAAFVKAVQIAPDETAYLNNLVAHAFKVRSLGLLPDARLNEVTAHLEKLLTGKSPIASLAPETADRLFSLACMTRRGVLAQRLLSDAAAAGRQINVRDDKWNIALVELCSDDPETFRHGASAVTDTLMGIYEERPLTKWWTEVPSEKGRPEIKSLCRESGTEGLLLLWCIAKCENDEAGAEAIRTQLKNITTSIADGYGDTDTDAASDSAIEADDSEDAYENKAVDLLSRFIDLHRNYQQFSDEEWVVFQGRTFRSWLPDLFPPALTCSTCLELCIAEADFDHGHPLLHEFITETIKGSDNPAETLLDFIGSIGMPQKEQFNQRAQWLIETAMLPADIIDSGAVTLNEEETRRLKASISECLKLMTEDPEADTYNLKRLDEVYRRYGLQPDIKILSALLEDLTGKEFTAMLEKMMQEGYSPDIETLGLIVREDLRTGDVDKAAADFERFRQAASGDESFAPAVAFLQGLLETAAGEYEKAYALFLEVDGASGEMDRPEHCFGIWGDTDDFDSCLDFHLFAGAAYSGHHTEAIELAPRVFRYRTCDYPWEIDELPVCLALLRSGLYDDATILYNSQVNTSIEKGKDIVNDLIAEDTDKAEVPGIFIERTYIRAIFMLIHIENALHLASEGVRSAKLVLSIAGRLMRSWLPPMCAYEYVKAQAALDGFDPRKPSK